MHRNRTFSTLATQAAVDSPGIQMHHCWVSTNSPTIEKTQSDRRSSRVFMRIPVRAAGLDLQGRRFRENSQTIVVSAHGGLLYLNESLEMGVQLTLINPVTEEEQECRVVFLGDASDKGQRVGIEFLYPSPHFWGVEFTPSDWSNRPAGPPPH